VASRPRARPVRRRTRVRDLGPRTHRAQLGRPDDVRHPIYSGILVAGAGTALALGWTWLIAVLLAGVYFVYSATVEERYMNQLFPDTYPGYKRSTKMLVPFVF